MNKNAGFSLMEVLISVTLMGILASITIPTFRTIQDKVRDKVLVIAAERFGNSVSYIGILDNLSSNTKNISSSPGGKSTPTSFCSSSNLIEAGVDDNMFTITKDKTASPGQIDCLISYKNKLPKDKTYKVSVAFGVASGAPVITAVP